MLHSISGTFVPIGNDGFAHRYPLRTARVIGARCKYCKETFFPTNKRGPVPYYCSRSCQSRAYRERQVQLALSLFEGSKNDV